VRTDLQRARAVEDRDDEENGRECDRECFHVTAFKR
jgi:hypothetical protein